MKDELDILKAPYKPEIVYESIFAALPSIELVDSRFEDWTVVGVKNLIADHENAINKVKDEMVHAHEEAVHRLQDEMVHAARDHEEAVHRL